MPQIESIRDRAVKTYSVFTAFNVISFNFLSGNLITLLVLRLGADNGIVGVFSSFVSMSFMFTIVGRVLIRRTGAVRLKARFWALRYVVMIPTLLIFLPQFGRNRIIALVILGAGVFAFNISRGIAIAASQPIIGELTAAKNRGSFFARMQLITHSLSIAATLTMALLLGGNNPIATYAIIVSAGIITGLFASFFTTKLPEPREARKGFKSSLSRGMRSAFQDQGFRRFLANDSLLVFLQSMITPFLIVYTKVIYGHSDGSVIVFTTIGLLGAVVMATLSGIMVDRVGSKPLFFTFSMSAVFAIIPLVAAPGVGSSLMGWILPAIVFFFFTMGTTGTAGLSQTYFSAATEAQNRLDYGIVLNLFRGLVGIIGPIAGGLILDALRSTDGLSDLSSFRIFFAALTLPFIALFFLVTRLPDIGAYKIQDVLGMIFSPRELRALAILKRLDRSKTLDQEKLAVGALGRTKSELSKEELILRMSSPSLFIRRETLIALRNFPIDDDLARLLISQTRNHPFTTAHLAAAAIGERQIGQGIGALRRGLLSKDYFLCGNCMISLAQLGDTESLNKIHVIFAKSDNPALVIRGARALEIFGNASSLPVIINKLERRTYPHLRDELILSIAGLIGLMDWFYPLYAEFYKSVSQGIEALEGFAPQDKQGEVQIPDYVAGITGSREAFAEAAKKTLGTSKIAIDGVDVTPVFIAALNNVALLRLERFRYLVAAILVWANSKGSYS